MGPGMDTHGNTSASTVGGKAVGGSTAHTSTWHWSTQQTPHEVFGDPCSFGVKLEIVNPEKGPFWSKGSLPPSPPHPHTTTTTTSVAILAQVVTSRQLETPQPRQPSSGALLKQSHSSECLRCFVVSCSYVVVLFLCFRRPFSGVLVRCVVSEPSPTNVVNSMMRWVRSLMQCRRRLFARTLCSGMPGSLWCTCFLWVSLFCVQHSLGVVCSLMPRCVCRAFSFFVVDALLVASLVSLVLLLQWPVTFEVMLPSPSAWFIVMLMTLVGILVGLLSAFSWGRSFVDAVMRVPRFLFLVIAAVLAASLVSLVLFVSFGSALSLVWRCPIFLQFTMSVSLCLVCSRARLVLGCFGSGQAKDKKFSGKRVLRYPLICCKICLTVQVCGTCAAAYAEDFHKVASFAAAACEEAFLRLFTFVIYGFSNWLGTPGDRVASASVRITLQCVIERSSIAMLAMALLVCFSTGSGSSFLAIFSKDIGHVLGLRIVGPGCGGCQAWGLSVAWQAQATPRVDVAEVSIASSGLAGSGTEKMKAPSPVFPEHTDASCLCDADLCRPVQWSLSLCQGTGFLGGSKAHRSCDESE